MDMQECCLKGLHTSLVTRLSPLCNHFWLAYKEGESLVYFDHVLDVVGRGYRLTVDFAHVHTLLAGSLHP